MKRLRIIPLRFWLLTFVMLLFPILSDTLLEDNLEVIFDEDTVEMFWLIALVPSVIFSYYLGLRGGLFISAIAIFLHLFFETIEAFQQAGFDRQDILVTIMGLFLHISIAVSVGILADKLKSKELESVKLNMKLERLSFEDELTGLYNRRGFIHLSEQVLSNLRQSDVACLFIDLDEFKPINDKFGHEIGDEFLKIIAKRLQYCVRENDLIGRLGGDEFICLLKNSNSNVAEQIATRIVLSLSNPVVIRNQSLFVTASIGIAITPQGENNIDELMKKADNAMYEAKKQGKNRFHFYEKDLELEDSRCEI